MTLQVSLGQRVPGIGLHLISMLKFEAILTAVCERFDLKEATRVAVPLSTVMQSKDGKP